MAEEKKNQEKSPQTSVIVTVLIALVAIVLIVVATHGKKAEITEPKETQEKPVKLTAAQQTQALVDERMNDKAYRAELSKCQAEQTDIARKSSALQEEISNWIISNEKAKSLSRKITALATNATANAAEIDALRKELDAAMRADSEGKRLLERQDDLKDAFEAAKQKTADIIGARIRMQTAPKKEPDEAK